MHEYQLIYCPACEHACSEAAAACPQCGHPFRAPPVQPPAQHIYHRPPPVQTIERTGKKWKGLQLFGAAACIAGAIGSCSSPGSDAGLPFYVGLIGFGVFIYASICAWWDHG